MVATALTVYGIETSCCQKVKAAKGMVATALTVYGIETVELSAGDVVKFELQQRLPFTVLKLWSLWCCNIYCYTCVATALTVYGIETSHKRRIVLLHRPLQQRLPFTVLKHSKTEDAE